MHNMVYLIGRLTENPQVEKQGDKDLSIITLAVQRSFKNEDGVYDTDFISCELWNGVATNLCEYCKKGDLIGLKGRLQQNRFMDEETQEPRTRLVVVAEKVSFLASKKQDSEEE